MKTTIAAACAAALILAAPGVRAEETQTSDPTPACTADATKQAIKKRPRLSDLLRAAKAAGLTGAIGGQVSAGGGMMSMLPFGLTESGLQDQLKAAAARAVVSSAVKAVEQAASEPKAEAQSASARLGCEAD
jgi:hypothetical protein